MIKTLIGYGPNELDAQVNDFEKTQTVFATQTHVNQIQTSTGYQIQYTAVIFYKAKSDYNKS
jgi:hypothetical protein